MQPVVGGETPISIRVHIHFTDEIDNLYVGRLRERSACRF